MGIFDPETWFNNKTEDKMALITEDELGFRVDLKWIDPDHYVTMGYRKGIDRIGPKIHFLVHPVNRSDLMGPKIMPSHVFDHSVIDVVYKLGDESVSRRYRDGALVGFEFKDDTMFRRIGLVRTIDGICGSLAKLGNCCHAGSVLAPGDQDSAPVEVRPLLVAAQVPPDPSPHHYYDIGTVTDIEEAPNPLPSSEIEVVGASSHDPAPILHSRY